MKCFYLVCVFALFCALSAQGQVYTFKCLTDADTKDILPDSCEGCAIWEIESRSFNGLLIYEDAVPWRWIEMPYTLKVRGDTIDIWEHTSPPSRLGKNEFFPDRESITLGQTPFVTMAEFLDSAWCPLGAGLGQTQIKNDLPKYLNDIDAMADGLIPGDTYLLDCGNTLGMPAGVYKVVTLCGYSCLVALKYFADDEAAFLAGIPQKGQYLVDETNPYGIQNGFLKLVVRDSIYASGGLSCDTVLTYHDNDIDAIVDGKMLGDLYGMSATNTYGAPTGCERAVSNINSTEADTPNCCSLIDNLPFFSNDASAMGS